MYCCGAGGGTLGVRVAGHVTASGPLGTCVQNIALGSSNWGDEVEEFKLGRPQEAK